MYGVRFIKSEHEGELIRLYHLARTALAGVKPDTRYNRLIWASGAFAKKYDYVSSTGAYKDLCGLLA